MMNHRFWKLLLTTFTYLLISGCVGDNVVSEEEIKRQNQADAAVAGILFENSLDTAASYNIRKNGSVVIKFDDSVSPGKYTDIVSLLRANSQINGVRAEQSGAEVCPLKH